MDEYESFPSRLASRCNELRPHIQNQSLRSDVYRIRSIIDGIFKDPAVDLLSVLPSSSYEDEYDQVVELFGTKSVIWKVLVESATSDLFEYFMMSFCRHLDQSGCTLPPNIVEKSAYMTLLSDYVCFMMPVNNQFQIATKEAQNSARRSTLNSPLNLFKEEALRKFAISPSSDSLRALHSMSHSVSPHFLPFICILIRSYCSLSNWPSDYRLMALRFILKEIHVFTIAGSENSSLSQLKTQLQWNAPYADALHDFFYSLFTRWPPNPSFNNLFDVWTTWIRPWRYSESNVKQHMSFIHSNRRFYTELSSAFCRRYFRVNNTQDVHDISIYITFLTSPEMLEVYSSLDYDIEPELLTLIECVTKSARTLRQNLGIEEEKLRTLNWFRRTFFYEEEQAKIEEMRKTVSELDVLLTKINSARLDDGNDENFPDADTDQRAECLSPQWPKRTPDYQLDPVTKLMYLTPLGRRQVGRGTHRFDYRLSKLATPPIVAPLNSSEVWWLSRLLYQLSRRINRTQFVQHLSRSYEDSHSLLGYLARCILDPEYPNVYVPADSEIVAFQKPCVNLRYFARYSFLIPFAVFIFLCTIFPLSYVLIIFFCMLLFAKLTC